MWHRGILWWARTGWQGLRPQASGFDGFHLRRTPPVCLFLGPAYRYESGCNYVSTFILGLNPLCKFIIDTTMTFKICFRISTRDKCWWIIKICYCIYHASRSENIFKLRTAGICVGTGRIGRPEAFAGVAEFKSVFGSARMVNTITYFNYSSTFVLCPDSLCKLIICTTITSKLCFLIWIGCKCFCKY